ncbi:MAG: PAS domain-containing protein [Proteobacteria bacterium]|jgi:PAS domain S-box-containing protein|nr:PAS domain-containing protein [Pseudomonadota bacterium]
MLHTLEIAHNILDAIPLGIFWKDKNSVYLGCNKWHADRIGLTTGEIVGKTDYDLCWSAMADKYIQDDQAVMGLQETQEFVEESRIIGHDGKEVWAKTTKMPLIVNNQVIGVLGFWQDLTELDDFLTVLSKTLDQASSTTDKIGKKIDSHASHLFDKRQEENSNIFKQRQSENHYTFEKRQIEDKARFEADKILHQAKDNQTIVTRQAENDKLFTDRESEDKE